jgi:phage terminase large subunit GpA-like protein
MTLSVGFHLSALYAPLGWLSWARIAAMHEQARGNDETLKAFVNAVLGGTWVESGEAPNWECLAGRPEDYRPGLVPDGALLVTAGVDVQKDRIEVGIWGWGWQCWLIEHWVLIGDTARDEVWQELSRMLHDPIPTEAGGWTGIATLAIDSGFATQEVYGWVRFVRVG